MQLPQVIFVFKNRNGTIIATVMVLVINVITHLFRVLLRRNTQIFFRGTTRDLQVALGKEILKIEFLKKN